MGNTNEKIKSCCANFYQNELVALLLGDSFHPGGLELTKTLCERLKITSKDKLLDVASGNGASAIFIAKEFGCSTIGVDYSNENVHKANEAAKSEGLNNVEFRVGDAEQLPFEPETFDAVISECSLCTFPNKEKAASEMFRVLKKGGRIGITDVTHAQEDVLPEDLKNIIYRIACIADAKTIEGYKEILENAGFRNSYTEKHDDALLALIEKIRKRVLLAELAVGLGKLDLGNVDLKQGKKYIQRAIEEINRGTIGYALITGEK